MKKIKFLKVSVAACVFALASFLCASSYATVGDSYSEAVPFPCGRCQGAKTVPGANGTPVTCPNCKGTGNEPNTGNSAPKPEVKSVPFPDAPCKECKGAKGFNTYNGWETCKHCGGTGKEPK